MSQDDVLRGIRNRTSSPSLTERVRSFTALRSRVPSTARTVSANDVETETDVNADSDDDLASPERIRSDPGIYRNEHLMHLLDQSHPLADRVSVVNRISRQTKLYQMSSLLAICEAIKDFAEPGAPVDARKAVFAMAQNMAAHPELSADGRESIFAMISQPIDSQHIDIQAKCLRYITEKGTILDRFARALVLYINSTLKKQCEALFEARRLQKSQAERKKSQLPEERGLHGVLGLATDVLDNNPHVMKSDDQAALLDCLLAITEKTTSRGDMKRATTALGSFVQSFSVPDTRIKTLVEILCAISSAVPDLSEDIKLSLLQILKSKQQAAVIKILLQTLALSPQDRHTHTVCGALSILCYLVESSEIGQNAPAISFAQFIESFWRVHFGSRRVRRDCLKTIAHLLSNPGLVDAIVLSNWQHMIETVLTATGDDIYNSHPAQPLTIRQQQSSDQGDLPNSEFSGEKAVADAAADDIYESLKRIAASLNRLWPLLNHDQHLLIARFHYELRAVLPSESLRDLVSIMAESGFINPIGVGWRESQNLFVNKILSKRHVDSQTYCDSLYQLKMVILRAQPTERDRNHYWDMAKALLRDFPLYQKGWQAAVALVTLVATIWRFRAPQDLAEILRLLKPLLRTEPEGDEAILTTAPINLARTNIGEVTVSLVDVYLSSTALSYSQSTPAYLFMFFANHVVNDSTLLACVRLPALRLLTRLRCDQSNFMFVTKNADTLALAAALNRADTALFGMGPRNEVVSVTGENRESRKSRTSAYGTSAHASKAALRASIGQAKSHSQISLWSYPGTPGLPREPPEAPHAFVRKEMKRGVNLNALKISEWLLAVIQILQNESDWEVYSYAVVHLPSQLCNLTLFSDSMPVVKHLRKVIVGQLRDGTFNDPPAGSGVKKGDVALCLINALTILLGYCDLFEDRSEMEDTVRTFLICIGEWERSAKACIQALTICCHVLPTAMSKRLPEILQKMAQIITQSQLTVDVLEFLGGLARLPDLYADFRENEYRTVFAICIKYLEHSREQRLKLVSRPGTSRGRSSNRISGLSTRSSPTADSNFNLESQKDLPQYVFVLTYHVLTVWFLSLRLVDRHKHVGWITKNLAWIDEDGVERMEEQSQVTLDMMLRATYSELGETAPDPQFRNRDIQKRSWLVGLSIVTIETCPTSGLTQFTKRQASGTTHAVYRQLSKPLPPHHVLSSGQSPDSSELDVNVFPNHFFLQLAATAAPNPIPMEPIYLPDDDMVTRALAAFDRNDTVDGYKVAVIYVGNGQSEEGEILSNTRGSPSFHSFVKGLGTRVRLCDAMFNTQGLDKMSDLDGTHTYAWRDRVVEIVYHIPVMMPTDKENDPRCVNKKRHVGNNYVSIIWNESGLPFNLDTFQSQFNFVNIVIAPENKLVPETDRFTAAQSSSSVASPSSPPEEEENHPDVSKENRHYTIQLLSQPSLPRISPAAIPKMLPFDALAGLVRQLALSSSVFCNVWANRTDGEYVSSWRSRLREIVRLRERYINSGTSTSVKYPGAKGTKTYTTGDAFTGRVQMGGLADQDEGVAVGLDFSRWAGAPPGLG